MKSRQLTRLACLALVFLVSAVASPGAEHAKPGEASDKCGAHVKRHLFSPLIRLWNLVG